jgi:hypothetical protein
MESFTLLAGVILAAILLRALQLVLGDNTASGIRKEVKLLKEENRPERRKQPKSK